MKTEVVTMRLAPKIRYALELLSRAQRRNISQVMEWLIIQNLDIFAFEDLWDIDEQKRLLKLKAHEPSLLTFDEEVKLEKLKALGAYE